VFMIERLLQRSLRYHIWFFLIGAGFFLIVLCFFI
jgi:surface polysaccharide O-acyltransferase-like enzyme